MGLACDATASQENNFRRKLNEFAAEDCADLERLKLIECSGTCSTARTVQRQSKTGS